MPPVYAIASNIVSGLGLDTEAHLQAIAQGRIAIKKFEDRSLSSTPFWASMLAPGQWQAISNQTAGNAALTPFEQMAAFSIKKALSTLDEPIDLNKTAFILSTTKGNIELLGKVPDERLLLHHSAKQIAAHTGIGGKTIVVSHACVSGIVALQYGMRLLQSGRFKHAIVTGCDRFSRFVLNGFQSFQAISDEPCRPFDADRKGINLGEAVATIVLSAHQQGDKDIQLVAGATSNDANHISGPSRTGEELAMAINRAMIEADIAPARIGMVSAHGTATVYNDEMESKAFDLAGLLHAPVHSFKGYVGHTLGAAGVLESIVTIESLKHQMLVPSSGYENLGVPKPVNVSRKFEPASFGYALKTASGFGGCNAVAIWKKP